jgi:hypothetical protein
LAGANCAVVRGAVASFFTVTEPSAVLPSLSVARYATVWVPSAEMLTGSV